MVWPTLSPIGDLDADVAAENNNKKRNK